MELYEKTVSSEEKFKGVIVDVRLDRIELPNGRPATREVVSHPGGVAILPLHDDGTVTVVRQFRYPFGRVITELPAGKLERGEVQRNAGGADGLDGHVRFLLALRGADTVPIIRGAPGHG